MTYPIIDALFFFLHCELHCILWWSLFYSHRAIELNTLLTEDGGYVKCFLADDDAVTNNWLKAFLYTVFTI